MHLESDGSRFSGAELSKSQVFPWPPSLEILPREVVCVCTCLGAGAGAEVYTLNKHKGVHSLASHCQWEIGDTV